MRKCSNFILLQELFSFLSIISWRDCIKFIDEFLVASLEISMYNMCHLFYFSLSNLGFSSFYCLTAVPGSSAHGIFQAGILDWVPIPFSRGSFWPRNHTQVSCVSCIAGRFFTHWAIGEAHIMLTRFLLGWSTCGGSGKVMCLDSRARKFQNFSAHFVLWKRCIGCSWVISLLLP